jgi:microcystin degradation protein MlrC
MVRGGRRPGGAVRMVRVAFCGISHETNTFATAALGLTTLESFAPRVGAAVLESNSGYMRGMHDAAKSLGYECVGLLFGITEPSGTIADAAFESMRDEICQRLRAAMPVDVVAVENHGAGVAESCEDIEGSLALAIRAVVGPDTPLIGTWDLHGNMTPQCVAAYDFSCPVQLYPHTDAYERGLEAMGMVPRLLKGLETAVHLELVPTLLPACSMCTHAGFPAAEMNAYMRELEGTSGVLDCTVFHGFPWADISIVGSSVLVTTENADAALAKRIGQKAAAWIWANKERFAVHVKDDGLPGSGDPTLEADVHTAPSALVAARRWIADGGAGPVCVNETADNTGCGAPGDATHLLRAMLDAGPWQPGQAAFGWIYDPATLQQALGAGVGSRIQVRLGGKLDPELVRSKTLWLPTR